ncbi:MAG: pyrroline-5-carboxylate reductase [Clostridia bacterium]|nr:pyrroline-5-carboxylate reductase [Clostridia bacterium]
MKIGFIGCGNMGSALAKAVAKYEGAELYLSDHNEPKAISLAKELSGTALDNCGVAELCEVIFLAVKPNIIATALESIKEKITKRRPLIVSMAAGVKLEKLLSILGEDYPVIRIMPNTPCAVGKGMITWCKSSGVGDAMAADFEKMLSAAGRLDMLPEGLIDAASAVAGCGPAFVYMFADALADGGVAAGLPRDKALSYAIETIIGAGEMMKATGKHPETLKDEVCSPGGSTIEGVLALEDGAFRSTASGAVIAAYEKTKKLGK